jgi:hypothetical protein
MSAYLTGSEDGIKELCEAIGYRGRKVQWEAAETVNPHGTYWDGGSRNTYTAVQLGSLRTVEGKRVDPPQFGGGTPAPINLVPGVVVVEHSIFCGKDMGLHIYVHPSDAPRVLPAEPEGITEDMQIVLAFTSGLKNTYAGRTNVRFEYAARKYGITSERWETAKAECISRKLLNRAGAITPAGRNIDTGNIRS